MICVYINSKINTLFTTHTLFINLNRLRNTNIECINSNIHFIVYLYVLYNLRELLYI